MRLPARHRTSDGQSLDDGAPAPAGLVKRHVAALKAALPALMRKNRPDQERKAS